MDDLVGRDSKRIASQEQRETVWRMQGGRCGSCQGKMTIAAMEVHHLLPHSYGGGTGYGNLIGLHKECHKKITKGQAQVRNEFKKFGGF